MTRMMHARRASTTPPVSGPLATRVKALDWATISAELGAHGCATIGPVLTAEECAGLAQCYAADKLFRSRVVMARHGFGCGEYKYFAYPLPNSIAALRQMLYPPLAEIANRWNEAIGVAVRYPPTTPRFSGAVTRRVRQSRRRCFCNTVQATTIACTRISTASMSSRCKWRSCCHSLASTSPAASSCLPSSVHACSHVPRSCRWSKGKA
jgi:Oxygenase, catalysing oxidative methylation of damaged DNA